MTFLKVKDGIVNLAAIQYIRRVQSTITLYFESDFYDISFERDEEAEEYLSALGTLLDAKEPEAKSDRSADPIFTETEGDAVELAFEAASKFGRYKEAEAMAWIREKSKLVAAAVQRIGFLELCNSAQPDVIRGQLRAIFAAEKSRAVETGIVCDSATQLDDGVNKKLLDFVAPRTDEHLRMKQENGHVAVVSRDFARQLETELADARAEIERLKHIKRCLREEFLLNTQNYPKEYHALFQRKFKAALSAAERGGK